MADKKLLAVQKMYEARIRRMEEQIEYQTKAIYGGLCLALHDIGVSKDGIIMAMQATEEYWNDSLENDWDIVDAVRETVGINIINVVEGKEQDES